jgi:hypothetical protein
MTRWEDLPGEPVEIDESPTDVDPSWEPPQRFHYDVDDEIQVEWTGDPDDEDFLAG